MLPHSYRPWALSQRIHNLQWQKAGSNDYDSLTCTCHSWDKLAGRAKRCLQSQCLERGCCVIFCRRNFCLKTLEGYEHKKIKCVVEQHWTCCARSRVVLFSVLLTGIDIWMELTTCSHGSSCFSIPGQVKDFLTRSVHAHSKRFTRTTR